MICNTLHGMCNSDLLIFQLRLPMHWIFDSHAFSRYFFFHWRFLEKPSGASPWRTVGHWNGCMYTCGNVFTDPLFGCSASGTGRNYRTRRASWVTRCYVVIITPRSNVAECVRGVSRTIYLAFSSLPCDLDEMVVEYHEIEK